MTPAQAKRLAEEEAVLAQLLDEYRGPLPQHWDEYRDESGRAYYYNTDTHDSTFERPRPTGEELAREEREREIKTPVAKAPTAAEMAHLQRERDREAAHTKTTALNEETSDGHVMRPTTALPAHFEGDEEGDPMSMPHALANAFTPQEEEELRDQFLEYDEDGSGGIDPGELVKIFNSLKIDCTPDELHHMFAHADIDESGEIDFHEFVTVMAHVARGDHREGGAHQKWAELQKELGQNPVTELEKEAGKRDFDITYGLVEARKETAMQNKAFIMQVSLYGMWFDIDPETGEQIHETKSKTYQGIGNSTRKAKEKAAEAALERFSSTAPGRSCEAGDVPDEWMAWLDRELDRGAGIVQCLAKLFQEKQFVPAANPALMQRIVTRNAFDVLQRLKPGLEPDEDGTIPSEWLALAKRRLEAGTEGEIVLAELVRLGFHPDRNPKLTQSLLKNVGHPSTEGIGGEMRGTFHSAANEGFVDDVKLFLAAGQYVDAEVQRTDGSTRTALQLACMGGKVDVVKMLLNRKADPNRQDRYGRTVLHMAAEAGRHECVEALLRIGNANVRIVDTYGNNALHLAAIGGCARSMDHILKHQKVQVMAVLSNKIPCIRRKILTKDKRVMPQPFSEVIDQMYVRLMGVKLEEWDPQYFDKSWVLDAAELAYADVADDMKHVLPKPEKRIVEYVTKRFDPDMRAGYWTGARGEEVFYPTIDKPEHLAMLLKKVFNESYINSVNKLGRSPLHTAAYSNLVCSHEDAVRCLLDEYGCDADMKDNHGKTPYQLFIEPQNRPGSAKGSALREEMIADKREIIREANEVRELAERKDREAKVWAHTLGDLMQGRMSCEAWEMMRAEAEKIRPLGEVWAEYLDTETSTRFYFDSAQLALEQAAVDTSRESFEVENAKWSKLAKAAAAAGRATRKAKQIVADAAKPLVEERKLQLAAAEKQLDYTKAYCWDMPADATALSQQRLGWAQMKHEAKFVKDVNGWTKYLDKETSKPFYFNPESGVSQWEAPAAVLGVAEVPKDPTGTKCKHKIKWEKCERCVAAWKEEQKTKVPPKARLYSETGFRKLYTNRARAEPLRQLGNWQEFVDLETGNLFYHTPANDDTEPWSDAEDEEEEPEFIEKPAEVPALKDGATDGTEASMVAIVPADDSDSAKDAGDDGAEAAPADAVNERMLGPPKAPTAAERKAKMQLQLQQLQETEKAADKFHPEEIVPKTQWEKPLEAAQAEKLRMVWATVRRRADLYREGTDEAAGGEYEEYRDPTSKQHFWYFWRTGITSTVMPPSLLPEDPASIEAERLAEIEKRKHKPVFASLEAVRQSREEEAWKKQLTDAYRKEDRQKELDKANEIERQKRLNRVVEKPYQVPKRRMAGGGADVARKKRAELEAKAAKEAKALIRAANGEDSEEDEAGGALLAGQRAGGGTASVALLKVRAKQDAEEAQLAELEDHGSSPRTAERRRLLRMVDGARRRMRNNMVVCDWGCKQWVMTGELQRKHQDDECPLRLVPCTLKCNEVCEECKWEEYVSPGSPDLVLATIARLVNRDVKRYGRTFQERPLELHTLSKPLKRVRSLYSNVLSAALQEQPPVAPESEYPPREPDTRKRMPVSAERAAEQLKALVPDARQARAILEGIGDITPPSGACLQDDSLPDGCSSFKAEKYFHKMLLLARAVHGRLKQSFLVPGAPSHAWRRGESADPRYLPSWVDAAYDPGIKRDARAKLSAEWLTQGDYRQLRDYSRVALQFDSVQRLEAAAKRLKAEYDPEDIELKNRFGVTKQTVMGWQDVTVWLRLWVPEEEGSSDEDYDSDEERKPRGPTLHGVSADEASELVGCCHVCEVQLQLVRMARGRSMVKKPMRLIEEGLSELLAEVSQRDTVSSFVWSQLRRVMGAPDESKGKKKKKGAGAFMAADGTLPFRMYHELFECPRRLVPCPLRCGELVHFDQLDTHLRDDCVKRPVPPMPCRLGCGKMFAGGAWRLLELEEERLQHEFEECPHRMMDSGLPGRDIMIMAKDRNKYRTEWIEKEGVRAFTTPGEHIYQVGKQSRLIMVELWGAGGGSGALLKQRAGVGGAGAAVQCIVRVAPGEKLTVMVGQGGGAGVYGKLVQAPPDSKTGEEVYAMSDEYACAPGGLPGGGRGHSGNKVWACGGGGGYSAITRKGIKGVELVAVAGGGGGGGTRDGVPGGAFHGEQMPSRAEVMKGLLRNSERDPINGRLGSLLGGGACGECPPSASIKKLCSRLQIRANNRFKRALAERKPIKLDSLVESLLLIQRAHQQAWCEELESGAWSYFDLNNLPDDRTDGLRELCTCNGKEFFGLGRMELEGNVREYISELSKQIVLDLMDSDKAWELDAQSYQDTSALGEKKAAGALHTLFKAMIRTLQRMRQIIAPFKHQMMKAPALMPEPTTPHPGGASASHGAAAQLLISFLTRFEENMTEAQELGQAQSIKELRKLFCDHRADLIDVVLAALELSGADYDHDAFALISQCSYAMQQTLQFSPEEVEHEVEREFASVAMRRIGKIDGLDVKGTHDEVRARLLRFFKNSAGGTAANDKKPGDLEEEGPTEELQRRESEMRVEYVEQAQILLCQHEPDPEAAVTSKRDGGTQIMTTALEHMLEDAAVALQQIKETLRSEWCQSADWDPETSVTAVAGQINAELFPNIVEVYDPGLKRIERALAKVRIRCSSNVRYIKDLARLSVTCQSTEGIRGCVNQLKAQFDVRALTNRCLAPTPLGYRDIVLTVAVPLPYPCHGDDSTVHLCEIVVQSAASRDCKKKCGCTGAPMRKLREHLMPMVPGTYSEELMQVRGSIPPARLRIYDMLASALTALVLCPCLRSSLSLLCSLCTRRSLTTKRRQTTTAGALSSSKARMAPSSRVDTARSTAVVAAAGTLAAVVEARCPASLAAAEVAPATCASSTRTANPYAILSPFFVAPAIQQAARSSCRPQKRRARATGTRPACWSGPVATEASTLASCCCPRKVRAALSAFTSRASVPRTARSAGGLGERSTRSAENKGAERATFFPTMNND